MAALFPGSPLSSARITPSAALLGAVDIPPRVGASPGPDELLAFRGHFCRNTADDDVIIKNFGMVVLPGPQATPLGLLHLSRSEAIALALTQNGDRPSPVAVAGRGGGGSPIEEVEYALLEVPGQGAASLVEVLVVCHGFAAEDSGRPATTPVLGVILFDGADVKVGQFRLAFVLWRSDGLLERLVRPDCFAEDVDEGLVLQRSANSPRLIDGHLTIVFVKMAEDVSIASRGKEQRH